MTDAYTYISKPVGTPYTNTNVQGREQYDQSDVSYDDPNVFYDGVNLSAYTNVSKPTGGTIIRIGMATGLVMSPTYSREYSAGSPYTNVPKPTT